MRSSSHELHYRRSFLWESTETWANVWSSHTIHKAEGEAVRAVWSSSNLRVTIIIPLCLLLQDGKRRGKSKLSRLAKLRMSHILNRHIIKLTLWMMAHLPSHLLSRRPSSRPARMISSCITWGKDNRICCKPPKIPYEGTSNRVVWALTDKYVYCHFCYQKGHILQ